MIGLLQSWQMLELSLRIHQSYKKGRGERGCCAQDLIEKVIKIGQTALMILIFGATLATLIFLTVKRENLKNLDARHDFEHSTLHSFIIYSQAICFGLLTSSNTVLFCLLRRQQK